jgi:Carboxypeptidase regulatory-like domain
MKSRPPGYRRTVRLLIVLLLAGVACAAAPAATAPTLAGRVTVASSEPQCSPKGCGRPLAPITLRFARNGRVRSVTTGAAGTFRAWLPSGTYRVSTSLEGAAISPVRVTVRLGATRRVTFVLRLNAA